MAPSMSATGRRSAGRQVSGYIWIRSRARPKRVAAQHGCCSYLTRHRSAERPRLGTRPQGATASRRGCDHCYAMTMSKRLKAMGAVKYQLDGDPRTSGPGFGVAVREDALAQPYRWRKPRIVFVNSMSDLPRQGAGGFCLQGVRGDRRCPAAHLLGVHQRSTRLRRLAADLIWPANLWMGVIVETADYQVRVDDLRGGAGRVAVPFLRAAARTFDRP